MKISCSLLFSFFSITAFAQLSERSQTLYNECYNKDEQRGKFALDKGVKCISTPDSNSFYLQWFPKNAKETETPLIVSLHGSEGNAFNEFYLWYKYAAKNKIGIIAVQWYKGSKSTPNSYVEDSLVYHYIAHALARINYPKNKALLHGFSRGSAISYAIAFRDAVVTGNNYFGFILSNSGKAEYNYPLYKKMSSGIWGHNFYNGKKWLLFCGREDKGINSCCEGMYETKKWIEGNGGKVEIFIDDEKAGHGGFHHTPKHINTVIDYYLKNYKN